MQLKFNMKILWMLFSKYKQRRKWIWIIMLDRIKSFFVLIVEINHSSIFLLFLKI
jgi:hypothetical protein